MADVGGDVAEAGGATDVGAAVVELGVPAAGGFELPLPQPKEKRETITLKTRAGTRLRCNMSFPRE